MSDLTSSQRRFLSARASLLKPVVMLGKEGPTPGLTLALQAALDAHELVKLKFVDYKDERRAIAEDLAVSTGAELVRVIGNVAVYYKPADDPEKRRFKLP